MASKYDALSNHLREARSKGELLIEMTFEQVDALIPGGLPPSSKGRTWWANNSQVQAVSVRKAGWHIESVDMRGRHVRYTVGEVGGSYAARTTPTRRTRTKEVVTTTTEAPPTPHVYRAWPWEGAVQDTFIKSIDRHGWNVTSAADTASKAHGIDVLASQNNRDLGAEVKGYPSKVYSDPARAHEQKRTRPSTQAGHWFSQALMKAMMLRSSHPDHESLVVVPDFPRYRTLAERTAPANEAAGVHIVFVSPEGNLDSSTWTPSSEAGTQSRP